METQISFSNQEKYPRQGFMQRNALSVKIILIGVLIYLIKNFVFQSISVKK